MVGSEGSSHISARQLEIVRQLAAREAARRQAQAEKSRGKLSEAVAVESGALRDADQIDAKTLETIVDQEKSRNDVAWAKVKEVGNGAAT